MTTAHTPEPWTAYKTDAGQLGIRGEKAHVGQNSWRYVVVAAVRGRRGRGPSNQARIVACVNACAGLDPRLIAAAPSLREALEAIETECRDRLATGCGYDSTIHELAHDVLEGLGA